MCVILLNILQGSNKSVKNAIDRLSNKSINVGVADPTDLLRYVRESYEGDRRVHMCTLCSKFSHTARSNVRNHVESVHFPNTFSYPCALCDKSFPTKQSVQTHKSRTHKYV